MRLMFLALAALLAACNPPAPPFKASELGPVDWGRDITLTAHTGQPLGTASLRGRVAVLFFGYTHCPDVCPMTLHKTAQLFKTLGADSERIKVVFISIDTTRDDAKTMKEFVEKFDPRIVGLTGDPEALQAVANEFGILTRRYQGKTALAYTLVHSSLLYLVDPEGRVRIMYPGSIGIEAVAADLRRLWREPADPRAQAATR